MFIYNFEKFVYFFLEVRFRKRQFKGIQSMVIVQIFQGYFERASQLIPTLNQFIQKLDFIQEVSQLANLQLPLPSQNLFVMLRVGLSICDNTLALPLADNSLLQQCLDNFRICSKQQLSTKFLRLSWQKHMTHKVHVFLANKTIFRLI